MDVWPTDSRGAKSQTSKNKGKGKHENAESPWNCPVFERGSLSAATLLRKGNQLGWDFIGTEKAGRQLHVRDHYTVFPQTRSDASPTSHGTLLQQVEQGAHFLRTYFPDADVPSQLIRDEIAADARITQELHHFDPYSGNCLEVFLCSETSRKSSAFLAFPMGDLNNELNISPFEYSGMGRVTLRPAANSVRTFTSPIQQIVASHPTNDSERQQLETVLGVRTYASTSFLETRLPTNNTTPRVTCREIMSVTRSDVGDRHIIDMVLPATRRMIGLVVNNEGAVYRCSAPEGKTFTQLLYSPISAVEDNVFRIALLDDEDSCLLLNGISLRRLDLRIKDSAMEFCNVRQTGAILTSAQFCHENGFVHAVTTQELLWFDLRQTAKPLLSVKHGRNFDRSLEARTCLMSESPITFLTSRRNDLITVYDISRPVDSFIRMNAPPYCLPPIRLGGRPNGHALLRHPADATQRYVSMLQLSELGSVGLLNLECLSEHQVQTASQYARFQNMPWPEDVQQLKERAEERATEVSALEGRTLTQVNMSPAYIKLFRMEPEITSVNPESAYDTLEKMPDFWQANDGSGDHAVTTFDIAFNSGSDPEDIMRTDFFAGTALHNRRGYRALIQGRVPIEQLQQRAPWHINITPFLQRFIPDIQQDPSATTAALRRYDLVSDYNRTAQSFQRESEASEQLTLDLALSADIYTPQKFDSAHANGIDDALETMSRAAEAMSLQEDTLPLHFSFLRPSPIDPVNHYANAGHNKSEDVNGDPMSSPGIKLLLGEWKLGTDPNSYVYEDPYDLEQVTTTRGARLAANRMTRPPELQVGSQRPPVIAHAPPLISQAPPVVAASQPLGVKSVLPSRSQEVVTAVSQPTLHGFSQFTASRPRIPASQDMMASTQVLPGPHGGRMALPKKSTKKRVGGF